MARDRRRRILRETPPHRPLKPENYRTATREGSREWIERAARQLDAYREIMEMRPEDAELYVFRRLAGQAGAYSKWAHYYARKAEEYRRAGRAVEAEQLERKALMYEDLANLDRAIAAQIREYGFSSVVVDELMRAALQRREPDFSFLDRIPGRTGELVRALAYRMAETMWARGRGMRDWGVIVCDPATLNYIKTTYPSYRFRTYLYREDREVREWETRGGRKYRSRAIHKYYGYRRGDELDYANIMRWARYETGEEGGCVELIPEG